MESQLAKSVCDPKTCQALRHSQARLTDVLFEVSNSSPPIPQLPCMYSIS